MVYKPVSNIVLNENKMKLPTAVVVAKKCGPVHGAHVHVSKPPQNKMQALIVQVGRRN